MTELRIDLNQTGTGFRPGDVVRGTAYWVCEDAPRHVDIHLFWYTRGKGTQDVQVVDAVRVDNPGRQASHGFALQLPAAPLSYSGRLVSICWGVELIPAAGGQSARADFSVTPAGQPELAIT